MIYRIRKVATELQRITPFIWNNNKKDGNG